MRSDGSESPSGSGSPGDGGAVRRVAYLVNQYPMVSLTFIRREIHALEARGLRVERFALRPWGDRVVDPVDVAEAERTRYVLAAGPVALAGGLLRAAVGSPVAMARAVRLLARVVRRSDRGLLHHVAYLAEACVLRGWLREAGVSHLHCHFGANPAEVAMLCRELGGPTYSFTVHGPEEFDRAAYLNFDETIARSSFVATISSFSRSQLYRWCRPGDWGKVSVVRCGVSGEFFAEPVSPAGGDAFVCVGRLCGQKGQLLLVEAAAKLAAEGRRFRLVLVGDGEMRGAVESAVARHGLGDRVTITGWAKGDAVREQLRGCRAMVLPSFAEGLPVAIMEALALGRPVISTYVAGIPELVTPECGWLVPAGSVEALAGAMGAALDADAATLSRMGEAGRRRVRERHDVDSEAAKLAQLIAGSGVPGGEAASGVAASAAAIGGAA